MEGLQTPTMIFAVDGVGARYPAMFWNGLCRGCGAWAVDETEICRAGAEGWSRRGLNESARLEDFQGDVGGTVALKSEVQIGDEATLHWDVAEKHSAEQHGNPGIPVLATPALAEWLELAPCAILERYLDAHEGTVGTHTDMRHLAATPIGMQVRTWAKVITVDCRRVVFEVVAHDEEERIAEGIHERFIIDKTRFLKRVAAKCRRA
jgi:fluoroacetyl-CoA thioesterase